MLPILVFRSLAAAAHPTNDLAVHDFIARFPGRRLNVLRADPELRGQVLHQQAGAALQGLLQALAKWGVGGLGGRRRC